MRDPSPVLPRTVETIYSPDKKKRVIIRQRPDGSYGFVEEEFIQDEYAEYWTPDVNSPGGGVGCHCDSLEVLWRELRGRVPWLTEHESGSG